jgi:hypothetical protein
MESQAFDKVKKFKYRESTICATSLYHKVSEIQKPFQPTFPIIKEKRDCAEEDRSHQAARTFATVPLHVVTRKKVVCDSRCRCEIIGVKGVKVMD